MDLMTVAKPYAKALGRIANKNNNCATWLVFLETLVTVTNNDKIISFVNSPTKTTADKILLVKKILTSIIKKELTAEENNLIILLIENSKLTLSSYILQEFSSYYANVTKKIDVISAYELNKNEQDVIIDVLEKKFNKKINLNLIVNKTLIGGVVIKNGDKVVDLSINARINTLNACLLIN